MEKVNVLCSTGAITHYPDFPDYRPIVEYGQHIDCDGFKLMIFPNWYSNIETIVNSLTASGNRSNPMQKVRSTDKYKRNN